MTRKAKPSLGSVMSGTSLTRSLMVKADFTINLASPNILPSPEIVEAMRRRILELEDALALATGARNGPPRKRVKTVKSTLDAAAPLAGPSTASGATGNARATHTIIRVDDKKINALLRKFWTTLQKEVKTEKYKFRGGEPKTCRIEEFVEPDDFHAIFSGKGFLIQPTPNNKPTSTVTIIHFGGQQVEELFGKHFKDLKGNRYSVGGFMANFEKAKKIGPVALQINDMTVTYQQNTLKCALKFEVEDATPYGLGRDEDFGEYNSYIYE